MKVTTDGRKAALDIRLLPWEELENADVPYDACDHKGGWVGEEALAIALYCCLRYPDDFGKAIITAVNHKGDSDSTGAIAGNILGAKLGYSAIGEKWTKDLELRDVILEVADDLAAGCQMTEYGESRDPVWLRKFVECHRFY